MKTIETNLIKISKEQFIELVTKKTIDNKDRYKKSLHELWNKISDIVDYHDANTVLQRFLMIKSDKHTFVNENYKMSAIDLAKYANQMYSFMFTNTIRLQKGTNNNTSFLGVERKILTADVRVLEKNYDFEQLSDWERRLLDTVLKLFVINNNWLKVLRGELVLEYDEEMIQELISYIERDWFQDSCFNLIEDLINLVKSKKYHL